MNCNYLTKTNTASLCRNNNVLVRASSNFTIRCCNNIDLNLGYSCYLNCYRICAFIKNLGECNLENIIVRFTIINPNNCCLPSCNYTIKIPICFLGVNCNEQVCINLRKTNRKQLIKVEVISNYNVLKEDIILV